MSRLFLLLISLVSSSCSLLSSSVDNQSDVSLPVRVVQRIYPFDSAYPVFKHFTLPVEPVEEGSLLINGVLQRLTIALDKDVTES